MMIFIPDIYQMKSPIYMEYPRQIGALLRIICWTISQNIKIDINLPVLLFCYFLQIYSPLMSYM